MDNLPNNAMAGSVDNAAAPPAGIQINSPAPQPAGNTPAPSLTPQVPPQPVPQQQQAQQQQPEDNSPWSSLGPLAQQHSANQNEDNSPWASLGPLATPSQPQQQQGQPAAPQSMVPHMNEVNSPQTMHSGMQDMMAPIFNAAAKLWFDEHPDISTPERLADIAKGLGSGVGQTATAAAMLPAEVGGAAAEKALNIAGVSSDYKPFEMTKKAIEALHLNYDPQTGEGKRAQLAANILTPVPGLHGAEETGEKAAQSAGSSAEEYASAVKNQGTIKSQQAASSIMDDVLKGDNTTKQEVLDNLKENDELGLPRTPLDAITRSENGRPIAGRNAIGIARASITTPGAEQELFKTLAMRDADESRRLSGHLDDTIGNNKAYSQLQSLRDEMKANGVNYDNAYASEEPIESDELNELLQRPSAKTAIVQAKRMAQDEGQNIVAREATEGKEPEPSDIATAKLFGLEEPKGEEGVTEAYNTKGIDYIKRALDDKIGMARKAGERNDARIYTSLKNDILNETDAINPDFALARQGHAAPARQEELISQGRNWRSKDVEPEEIANLVHGSDLTPAEKEAYLTGIRRDTKDIVTRRSDKTSPLNSLWTQDNRERLAAAMHPNDFSDLATRMREEQNMKANNNYILSGSPTAETAANQAAIKDAGETPIRKYATTALKYITNPKIAVSRDAAEFLNSKLQQRASNITPEVASELQKILSDPEHSYWSIGGENGSNR